MKQIEFEFILLEQRGAVGLITLNRPEKLNAWSSEMRAEIRRAMEECVASPEIGAIVLTGAGRAYCAGADVGNLEKKSEQRDRGENPEPDLKTVQGGDWTEYLLSIPKPTIAAVNGAAVGVGVTHLLPLDFRIASDRAKFGLGFVKMGISPELASSALLPRMIGTARALDWCLTGRLVPAEEALAAGLITEVVPGDALLDRALALGEQLSHQSGPAMRAIRDLIRSNQQEPDVKRVLEREASSLVALFKSPEHKESVLAFKEKRTPVFDRTAPD